MIFDPAFDPASVPEVRFNLPETAPMLTQLNPDTSEDKKEEQEQTLLKKGKQEKEKEKHESKSLKARVSGSV